MLKKLWIKHRSRLYAGLAFSVPYLAFAPDLLRVSALLIGYVLGLLISLQAIPRYIKWMLELEDRINLKLGFLTPARLLRVALHAPLVLLIQAIAGPGTPAWDVTLVLILASCCLHTVAILAAYKGWGDRTGNSLLSFCVSAVLITVTLLAPMALYLPIGLSLLLCWMLVASIYADLRSVYYPKHGVGVFFGSFNPVHKTHVRILRQAIQQRGLRKVYVHPTTVPKLHRVALEKGEISIAEQAGMRVYSTTAIADPYKQYFPTGRKFYEYELRQQLLQAAIVDAGLQDKVEILDWPAVYDEGGFFAVLEKIKTTLAPGEPLHGMHGSDVGGIWVRNIFELSGGIHPYPVVRSDCISATAIREGAVGYTTPTIEAFLEATRAGKDFVFPTGYLFKNNNMDRRLE
ncbi:hypothetical protein ACW4YW_06020 [Methylobacillus pratensis]